VIGINTLIVRNTASGDVAEGLGFAIPVNTAQVVAQQIIQKGYFARPYIGISFQPINPDIAAQYDLPAEWGVYVTKVADNSPASKAGLQQGDIITKVGDVTLDETHSYVNTLFTHKPGDKITLEVLRDNKNIQVPITLAKRSIANNEIIMKQGTGQDLSLNLSIHNARISLLENLCALCGRSTP
jgi:2-alkenal reductase